MGHHLARVDVQENFAKPTVRPMDYLFNVNFWVETASNPRALEDDVRMRAEVELMRGILGCA